MMAEALVGQQQKNRHHNRKDNKHIQKFLSLYVNSQCGLIFCFTFIGPKSNCGCRPEPQSVFTVLSDKPTSGEYKMHPSFNSTWLKTREGTAELLLLNKKTGQPRTVQRKKHSQDDMLTADTQGCSDTVCLHIKMLVRVKLVIVLRNVLAGGTNCMRSSSKAINDHFHRTVYTVQI